MIQQVQLQAFTNDELRAEALRIATPQYTDIFERCNFDVLPSPVERSKWGLTSDQLCSKNDVISYCGSFFLSPTLERIEHFIAEMRQNPRFNLSPFKERCLRRVHIFKAISKGIDRTHYPDALHLWTAEENGMDAFLTHDKTFRNVVARQKVTLHCKFMFPSDLIESYFSKQPQN